MRPIQLLGLVVVMGLTAKSLAAIPDRLKGAGLPEKDIRVNILVDWSIQENISRRVGAILMILAVLFPGCCLNWKRLKRDVSPV